jgi:hypothetical protein
MTLAPARAISSDTSFSKSVSNFCAGLSGLVVSGYRRSVKCIVPDFGHVVNDFKDLRVSHVLSSRRQAPGLSIFRHRSDTFLSKPGKGSDGHAGVAGSLC